MPALAQDVVVGWSAFTSGFGKLSSGSSRIRIITGQPCVGESSGSNASFSSGVLADPLIRGPLTGIGSEASPGLPTKFELYQNYPNPFNPTTTIRYSMAGVGVQASGVNDVRLVVYDVLGREIAVLVNELKTPGTYAVRFDGSRLASGVYVYRIHAGNVVQSKKLLLLREGF
ncbi:MAG: T9SS type A sorting domain-containing protein [Bacteroidota bacterium]